jgi:hypothetical protein
MSKQICHAVSYHGFRKNQPEIGKKGKIPFFESMIPGEKKARAEKKENNG